MSKDNKDITLDAVLADLAEQGLIEDTQFIKTSLYLMGAALQIQASIEAHFRKFNISQSGYGTLLLLYQYPEKQWTAAILAETFSVSKPTVTMILRSLEKNDWITREQAEFDRRVVNISLSENGKKKFKKLLPEHLTRVSNLFIGWSEQQHKDMQNMALTAAKEYKQFKELVSGFEVWQESNLKL